ncbi:pyridoxamine 5'-phosphate oxidase-domain-containing protein, partial [Lasiosphaeria miniovina]
RVPTSYESAVLARRILSLTPLGTLATVFPASSSHNSHSSSNDPSTEENRPDGLGGMPHGLMEYISDCSGEAGLGDDGSPTLLAITIETSFKNAAAGSNVSLAVQWTPPHPPAKRIQRSGDSGFVNRALSYLGLRRTRLGEDEYYGDEDVKNVMPTPPTPYSAANLPRFSLLGHVERIDGGDDRRAGGSVGDALAACFTRVHPDARYWLPGSRVHESHFVRLVVEQIYWIGGFGDRAYIGWISVDEWRAVTRKEIESVRLPGE